MNKRDLKYGNVVELRNKAVYLYNLTGTPLLSFNGEEGKDTSQYKNDLTFINNTYPELDIMKVYKDHTLKELLWERKEKPHLTDDEKAILRNIDKDFKYIVRQRVNGLYVFKDKPTKMNFIWRGCDCELICIFNHLFQFIKWEDYEPYKIEDLLKRE